MIKSLFSTQISTARDLLTDNRSIYRFKTLSALEVELKQSISYYNIKLSIRLYRQIGKPNFLMVKKQTFKERHFKFIILEYMHKSFQLRLYIKHIPTAENKWVKYCPYLEKLTGLMCTVCPPSLQVT